jgi:hypothetical protein
LFSIFKITRREDNAEAEKKIAVLKKMEGV